MNLFRLTSTTVHSDAALETNWKRQKESRERVATARTSRDNGAIAEARVDFNATRLTSTRVANAAVAHGIFRRINRRSEATLPSNDFTSSVVKELIGLVGLTVLVNGRPRATKGTGIRTKVVWIQKDSRLGKNDHANLVAIVIDVGLPENFRRLILASSWVVLLVRTREK